MKQQTRRGLRRAQKQKARNRSRLIWGGVGLGVIVVIVAVVVLNRSSQNTAGGILAAPVGEAVAILPAEHVEPGTDPGPYNSDPPTSGRHYAAEYNAGFYEETSPEATDDHPEGYLVHNLEHGYVIFWYNCTLLDETGCATLKDQIKQVMSAFDNFKVIAFPRGSIDVPLAMTSWGRIQRFETFDSDLATSFVRGNQNKAPEPNAP
ncbi:MAG TPA: DUF3105 domain-containing protein [Anaerolineales bacterium]|nr:DUF3105 domain-containing protein [Anaerolineales bacterium]